MDALRIAAGTISLVSDDAGAIVARMPTIVAAFWRLAQGSEPIAPRADLGHAANFLYMLSGEVPDAERVRGLETYLNTVVDHGLNASTFTARVITSTGSDLVSAVVGAIGALKGPLHGGAPGPALDMVFEIGDASRAEAVLRSEDRSGRAADGIRPPRLQGARSRAPTCSRRPPSACTRARGDMSLYRSRAPSRPTALRLLEEYKPGRRLQTNVEFYTALLLHGLGLDVALFTPTFAISRVSGWIAHALEQRREQSHHPPAVGVRRSARSRVDAAVRADHARNPHLRTPGVLPVPGRGRKQKAASAVNIDGTIVRSEGDCVAVRSSRTLRVGDDRPWPISA